MFIKCIRTRRPVDCCYDDFGSYALGCKFKPLDEDCFCRCRVFQRRKRRLRRSRPFRISVLAQLLLLLRPMTLPVTAPPLLPRLLIADTSVGAIAVATMSDTAARIRATAVTTGLSHTPSSVLPPLQACPRPLHSSASGLWPS